MRQGVVVHCMKAGSACATSHCPPTVLFNDQEYNAFNSVGMIGGLMFCRCKVDAAAIIGLSLDNSKIVDYGYIKSVHLCSCYENLSSEQTFSYCLFQILFTTHKAMRSKVLTFLVACSLGFAEATLGTRQSKTPYFLLIGDSTVAVDGGWGDGLLSYMKDTTRGENRGKSGATTISWKADGRWEELLGTVEANIDEYEPIVTVQFGHNDQKIMELDEFQTHLENIIHGIITAGGTPVRNSTPNHLS